MVRAPVADDRAKAPLLVQKHLSQMRHLNLGADGPTA